MFGAFIRALAFALALFPALASAQMQAFLPGTFQNRAALDPAVGGGHAMVTPIMNNANGTAPSNAATNYLGLAGGTWSATSTVRDVPVSISGTLSNLTFRAPTTIASGTYQITLFKNGSAAGSPGNMGCTISAGAGPQTCVDNTNAVSVSPGDTLMWQVIPTGTPATQTGPQISALFTSATNGESFVGMSAGGVSPSGSTKSYGHFGSGTGWNATEATGSALVPTAGVLDQLWVDAPANGAAKTTVWTVFKNGIATALTCTTTGAGSGSGITFCSDTNAGHSITVVATDTLSLECNPTGTPATGATRASLRWKPTTPGESIVINDSITSISTASARFLPVSDQAVGGTETALQNYVPTALTIKNLYASLDVAPGGGVPARALVLRSGLANVGTPGNVTCTMTTTANCNDTTNSYAAASGALVDLSETPSGTPAATVFFKASWVLYIP